MKKIAAGILTLVLTAGVVFLWTRPVRNHKPEIQEVNVTEQIPVTAVGREASTQPPSPAKPASPFRAGFSPEGAGSDSPIRITFGTPSPPALNQPVEVILAVHTNPEVAIPEPPAGRLEILLRLPAGIQLASEGWRSVTSSPDEQADPSGPWSLFEMAMPIEGAVPIPISAGKRTWGLARIPIGLKVVEEGTNWIITVRVRMAQGNQSWQGFGVLFATVEGKVAKFHAAPRKPGQDA